MYLNRNSKMDTDRNPSEWRFYGIGVIVEDKEPDTYEVIVSPIESLNNVGENLTTYEKRITTHLKDFRRPTGVNITKHAKVKALWYNKGNDTRITAPDVSRGELVDLYRLGDKELWYWSMRGKTQLYRRLEHINWQFNNTPDRNEDAIPNNKFYQFFMSTRDKFVRLVTSDNDKEACAWDFLLNTKKGIYSIVDGKWLNSIHWEATRRLITHTFRLIVFESMLFVRGNTSINDTFVIRAKTGNARSSGFIVVDKQLYVNGSINGHGSIRTTGSVESAIIKTLDIGANVVRTNMVLCGAAMFGVMYSGKIGLPANTPDIDGLGIDPPESESGTTTVPTSPVTEITTTGIIKSKTRSELTGGLLTDDIEATGTVDVAKDTNTKGNTTTGGDNTVGGNSKVTGNNSIGGDNKITGDNTVGGNNSVTGNSTTNGDNTTDRNLNVGNNTIIGNDLTVNGSTTVVDINITGIITNTGYTQLSNKAEANKIDIAELRGIIDANKENSESSAASISEALNQQALAQQSSSSSLSTNISANADNINSNASNISGNTDNISSNAYDIGALQSLVQTLTDKVDDLQSQIDNL